MKRKMRWAALMILSLLPGLAKADDTPIEAEAPIALTSPSAILCEASTGRVIFEKNADERRPVASVNKVMTILLTLEALDEGRVSAQDQVTVSPRAASMGGSQAFLDAGERYSLGELLKTVIVASANDSAVAIAEHLAGDFLWIPRREIYESRLFGPGAPHPRLGEFIGDGLVVAAGRRILDCTPKDMPARRKLIGQHAGLTESEMLTDVIWREGN